METQSDNTYDSLGADSLTKLTSLIRRDVNAYRKRTIT